MLESACLLFDCQLGVICHLILAEGNCFSRSCYAGLHALELTISRLDYKQDYEPAFLPKPEFWTENNLYKLSH